MEPGSTSGHSGEIAFTCAPAADPVLASGDQSEVQAAIQQFPHRSRHNDVTACFTIKYSDVKDDHHFPTTDHKG